MTFTIHLTSQVTIEADSLAEAEEKAHYLTTADLSDISVEDIVLDESDVPLQRAAF